MFKISINSGIIYINEIVDHFDVENVILPLFTNEFDKLFISEGSYGKVYKVKYNNESYILKIFKDKNDKDICLHEYSFLVEIPYLGLDNARVLNIEDKPALLMKEVPGLRLSDPQFQFLSILVILEVWNAILETMLVLSKLNIVHLDLKPDNIFYDFETKKAYIIDFGSAKRSGAPFKNINSTFSYAPPEFFLEKNDFSVSSKMDSYSLGIIAYELFGGCTIQDILKTAYPDCKNELSLQYKLSENYEMFYQLLRNTAKFALSTNLTYSDEINSLFEMITLTQSPIIEKRPTIEELYNDTMNKIKNIQSKQYKTLKKQLIKININSSSKLYYDNLWRNDDSDVNNICKLFNNYLKQSKEFLKNRKHTNEISKMLNSFSRYFPLTFMEKIYDAISEKNDFNPESNGSVQKRLAYIINKLSPYFECSMSNSSIVQNRNNELPSSNNGSTQYGSLMFLLLSNKPSFKYSPINPLQQNTTKPHFFKS